MLRRFKLHQSLQVKRVCNLQMCHPVNMLFTIRFCFNIQFSLKKIFIAAFHSNNSRRKLKLPISCRFIVQLLRFHCLCIEYTVVVFTCWKDTQHVFMPFKHVYSIPTLKQRCDDGVKLFSQKLVSFGICLDCRLTCKQFRKTSITFRIEHETDNQKK